MELRRKTLKLMGSHIDILIFDSIDAENILDDAVEMLLAGADAVAVGTAAMLDPSAPINIIDGIEKYMIENNFKTIKELQEAFCD